MKGTRCGSSIRNTLIVFFLAVSAAYGQIDERPAIGIFGAFNYNMHTADFRSLPSVPGCCPVYEQGEGSGFSAGVLYDVPLGNEFALSLRASFMTQNATLSMTEIKPVDIGGELTQAAIEHSIEVGLPSLGFEPLVGYRVWEGLSVHTGLRLAAVLNPDYKQQEQLILPETGTFENDRRIRNEYSGDLPDASSFSAALIFGISYELPLDETGELHASPEISYIHGLTPVISSYSWSAHTLRAGVTLRYRLHSPEEAQPPSSLAQPPSPSVPIARQPALLVDITAAGFHDGMETPVDRIVVEEFVSTNMRPLLPYVFFEENAAVIPDRYSGMFREETKNFHLDDLHTASTLEVYHDILNIIGQRMQEHAEATITLTGCNADVNEEKGNRALSRSRAEAVAAYFSEVWGIEANRLRLEAQDLPRIPSNMLDADGAAENRRVEIISSDDRILQPVLTRSRERQFIPQQLIFRPAIHSEAGVSEWSVHAHQDSTVLTSFTGTGTPPPNMTWDLARQFRDKAIIPQTISYVCAASDTTGRSVQSVKHFLPVEYITLKKKRANTEHPDKEIRRYSLIQFDFDRIDLSGPNRALVAGIRRYVQPFSTVRILGYTDRIGDVEYNARISLQRARNTADALGVRSAEVLGLGESELLFDNDLPEGRQYSRTVHIYIETPVQE